MRKGQKACKRMYGKQIIPSRIAIQVSKRVYDPKTRQQKYPHTAALTVVGYEFEKVFAVIQKCLEDNFGKINTDAPRRY